MDHDFVFQVKCTMFWLNRGLRVYLDLFLPNFSQSTIKYLFCTELVGKHGFKCVTAMCTKMVNLVFTKLFFFCFVAIMGFTWLKWLLNQKRLLNRVFCNLKKKYWGQRYLKVLFGKSGRNKSKYTLKPLLGKNMVRFT